MLTNVQAFIFPKSLWAPPQNRSKWCNRCNIVALFFYRGRKSSIFSQSMLLINIMYSC